LSEDDACSFLLFLQCFYAEVVHATIHVFHLLMITALADSTFHSPLMYGWAKPYFPNVFLKFEEVKSLLFGVDGALTGGAFNADRDKVLAIAKEMFCLWGSFKTAKQFVDDFLLVGITSNCNKDLNKLGFLGEFFKHVDLVTGYATEITEVFDMIQGGKDLKDCNDNLKKFFAATGAGVSKIEDLPNWIELMSVTGFMHGNTLSFSRLLMTRPVVRHFTPDDNFTQQEINFLIGTAGTSVGVTFSRSVFSDLMYSKDVMVLGLRTVITKYAALTGNLKAEYFKKISSEPSFKEEGWVLTDYCMDGVDGKSMTLTTYI